MMEGFIGLYLIFTLLLFRSFVDNDALRDCARHLKRIADALEKR